MRDTPDLDADTLASGLESLQITANEHCHGDNLLRKDVIDFVMKTMSAHPENVVLIRAGMECMNHCFGGVYGNFYGQFGRIEWGSFLTQFIRCVSNEQQMADEVTMKHVCIIFGSLCDYNNSAMKVLLSRYGGIELLVRIFEIHPTLAEDVQKTVRSICEGRENNLLRLQAALPKDKWSKFPVLELPEGTVKMASGGGASVE